MAVKARHGPFPNMLLTFALTTHFTYFVYDLQQFSADHMIGAISLSLLYAG